LRYYNHVLSEEEGMNCIGFKAIQTMAEVLQFTVSSYFPDVPHYKIDADKPG
jgi:hypothetical protein